MKKIFQVIYIADLYLYVLSFILVVVFLMSKNDFAATICGIAILVSILAFPILAFINLLNCIFMHGHSDDKYYDKIMFKVLVYRLSIIPFYIAYLIMGLLFAGATANPFLMILWSFIPGIIFIGLNIHAPLSFYAISKLQFYRRKNLMKKGECILHTILLLIFGIGLIDSIYLSIREGQLDKEPEPQPIYNYYR